MLSVDATITESKPKIYDLYMKNLKKATEKGVVAGFPKGKLNTPHYESDQPGEPGPSIIDVALWNNFGIGVPRRDFMTPASKRWQKYFNESLDALRKELAKDESRIEVFLRKMGEKGADFISQEIVALRIPPNSPKTIRLKGSSNPLVDSGDMQRAATYQIRRRDKR